MYCCTKVLIFFITPHLITQKCSNFAVTLMNYRLIIFDFDGTLCDTRHIIVTTMQATMRHMGLEVASDELCASTIGLPLHECFKHIYKSAMSDELARQCSQTYCNIFDVNKHRLTPTLFPGVSDTLKALSERGVTLAVASSRSQASLVELLTMMGVSDVFAMVLGCDSVLHPKPHPEAVLTIMKTMDTDPCHTLVVGDMPVDIEMGNRAGAHTCAVTWGNSSPTRLQEASPTRIIDRIDQLIY